MGGAIALAVLGGAAYLLSGGELPGDLPIFEPGPPTPDFEFASMKYTVEGTTETSEKDLTDASADAAAEIQERLTAFVQATFVDPDTWGDYEGVFEDTMTEEAAASAAEEVDVLTLGATANDDYEFVEPNGGKLRMIVLTDLEDAPVEASAIVTFAGTAEGVDGTFTTVKSKAIYLLRVEDGDWRIFSFDVLRNEKAAETPSSPASPAEASS